MSDADDVKAVKFRKRSRDTSHRLTRTASGKGDASDHAVEKAAAAVGNDDNDDDDDANDAVTSMLEAARALRETRTRKRGMLAEPASADGASSAASAAAAAAAASTAAGVTSLSSTAGRVSADDGGLQSVFAAQAEVTERSKIDDLRERYVTDKLEAEKKKWQEEALAAAVAAGGGVLEALSNAAKDGGGAGGAAGGARQFDEAQLYVVPAHLRPPEETRSAVAVPQTWAVGIEEIELPIEYKMRNIEATERAKAELHRQRRGKKRAKDESGADDVPANFATRRAANSLFHANSAPPLGGKTNVDLDLPPLNAPPVDTSLFYRNNAAASRGRGRGGGGAGGGGGRGGHSQKSSDFRTMQNFKRSQISMHKR